MNLEKFLIVVSKQDTAGMNIFSQIKKNYLNLKCFLVEEDSIHAENLDKLKKFKEFDFFIFATKHKSQQHNRTLSVHAPGNWKQADLGGKPEKVCLTSAFFLKHLFRVLNKNAEEFGYQVTLECTHHGPYIEKSCCFIEIGSSEEEWKDEKAGEIIAKTINEAISSFDIEVLQSKFKPVIGIGGLHYCNNFNRIQLNSEHALSHIIPEYALPMSEEMLDEAINKTVEKVELVLLDWKGLGKSEEKQGIVSLIEKKGLICLRASKIEK